MGQWYLRHKRNEFLATEAINAFPKTCFRLNKSPCC